MNKEYTTTITITHKNVPEAVRKLTEIMYEMLSRSIRGHFEEHEVGLGWETEVNENAVYMEDGFIKGKVGDVPIDPTWLQ